MKSKQLILAAFLVVGVAAFGMAQASWHGYMDYTNYLLAAFGRQDGANGMWQQSQYTASYGSWYGGRTEIRLDVNAGNYQFHTGIRLSNTLSTWVTAVTSAVFYKGNLEADFLNKQIKLYTGKFEEQNFGQSLTTYANGNLMGNHWAVSDFMFWLNSTNLDGATTPDTLGYNPQYFTAVRIAPSIIKGFSVIGGVPILTGRTDGVTGSVVNYWQNIAPRFKVGLSYAYQPLNATFKASYFNADDYDYLNNGRHHTEINVEGQFLNVAKSGIDIRAAYDLQLYSAVSGAMKHNIILSAEYRPTSKLWLALDERFLYASNYYTLAKTVWFERVWAKATYNLPNNLMVGLAGNFNIMGDSSGQVGYDYMPGDDGDLGVQGDLGGFVTPDQNTAGTTGSGLSFGANPFVQMNIGNNGFVSLGFAIQYQSYTSGGTNMALSYNVPLSVIFWF